MLLGCIADDLTGATDLALTLTRGGMRTVQIMGVPKNTDRLAEFDAVVIALKSRTNPVNEAIDWSIKSCHMLLAAGARQIIFKYCSTFDSTPEGNIGPVAEALAAELAAELTVVCPAFPTNKRTIYQGHLFVGQQLLSDSPMKDHPLTPMRDSNLVTVMQAQTSLKTGLVPQDVVEQGCDAVRAAFEHARNAGERFVVVDATNDAHLMTIGAAVADHKLITGGSGIAIGLPENYVGQNLLQKADFGRPLKASPGRALILCGSCSQATRAQVANAIQAGIPALRVEALELAAGTTTTDDIIAFVNQQTGDGPVLVYSSDTPQAIARVQEQLGREKAGMIVENAMAKTAESLVSDGVTKLIVAGGETSGAVVGGLGIEAIEIGPEIDPGVPWTRSLDGTGLVLALKSGNFGSENFFLKAWDKLA
ncbi:MAG: 3-oxo-tetronate kinase [Hyphomicrobiaceae bacterium]